MRLPLSLSSRTLSYGYSRSVALPRSYAAQLALASGCRVIVTSSSDAKLARARDELGVHGTVNYRTHRDWDVEVRKLTGGRGVDHVIEVGGKGTLVRSIRSCRPLGNVWVVGCVSLSSCVFLVVSRRVRRSLTPFRPSSRYMSDYAAGKVDGQDDEALGSELAKEILYASARVHGVVCGSRDMFEDMNRCVEVNKVRSILLPSLLALSPLSLFSAPTLSRDSSSISLTPPSRARRLCRSWTACSPTRRLERRTAT